MLQTSELGAVGAFLVSGLMAALALSISAVIEVIGLLIDSIVYVLLLSLLPRLGSLRRLRSSDYDRVVSQ